LFESRLNSVLLQFASQFEESVERIVEIRVDCHPLAALGVGVDRKQADGRVTVEVHPDRSQIQGPFLFDVRGTVVWMGFLSLDAVSKTVDEQSHKVFGSLAAYTKVGRHIWGLLS
jgi:hypothetical protein